MPYRFAFPDWFGANGEKWPPYLEPLLAKAKPVHLLEVGSFEGRSAVWMIDNMLTDAASTLICVDSWDPKTSIGNLKSCNLDRAKDNFHFNIKQTSKVKQVTVIDEPSATALRTVAARSLDFVYIDGHHYGPVVLTDAILAFDILKPGGVLIFDDYCWKESTEIDVFPGEAIDSFLNIFRNEIKILFKDTQVGLTKLRDPLDPRALRGKKTRTRKSRSTKPKH